MEISVCVLCVPRNAPQVNKMVFNNCETNVEPLFLSHRNFLLSLNLRLVNSHHLWYAQTSKSWTMTYTAIPTAISRGVLENTVRMPGMAKSFSLGI